MKYLLSLLLVGFLACPAVAQYGMAPVGFTPFKFTRIYGVNFNVFIPREDTDSTKYPRIYGVEADVNPVMALAGIFVLARSFVRGEHQPPKELFEPDGFVYGARAGLVGMRTVYGIDANLFFVDHRKARGLVISGFLNRQNDMKGIAIACFANRANDFKGIQIALFNTCGNLRGFQFGLINKNQRRTLPFVNWAFRR